MLSRVSISKIQHCCCMSARRLHWSRQPKDLSSITISYLDEFFFVSCDMCKEWTDTIAVLSAVRIEYMHESIHIQPTSLP